MAFPFSSSFRALVRPQTAFEGPPPTLSEAVRAMVLVWVPLALANAGLTTWRVLAAYQAIRRNGLPGWLATWMGADPVDLMDLLRSLPTPPAFGRLWPWLLVIVPISVLGTWLHHAVWDHTGLWLLGGLKAKRSFRVSLVAEAEALRIAAVGSLLGLLSFVPVLGVVLALPLMVLDAYLWLFRGFALATRHGCEIWKGLAATVVHAVLLGCCAVGLFIWMLALLRLSA